MITTFLMSLLFLCGGGGDETAPTLQSIVITRWEYKQVPVDASAASEMLQAQLDLLGEQGWELSAVIARSMESSSDKLLLKRRKTSNDVDIEFQPEIGLTTIRGDKGSVKAIVNVIEEIEKKKAHAQTANPNPSSESSFAGRPIIVEKKGVYFGVSEQARFENVGANSFVVIKVQPVSGPSYDYWQPLGDISNIKVFASIEDAKAFDKKSRPSVNESTTSSPTRE